MRKTIWKTLVLAGSLLAAGCVLAEDGRAAPARMLGKWTFHERGSDRTAGKDVIQRFRLTGRIEKTCLGGDTWYRAERLDAAARDGVPAAWQYKDGKLAVMLDSRICDAYTFYEGRIKGGRFAGNYVAAGWGRPVKGAAVSGQHLP